MSQPIPELLEETQKLRQKGQLKPAIALYNQLINWVPDSIPVMVEGIKLAILSGEYEQARHLFAKAQVLTKTNDWIEAEYYFRLLTILGDKIAGVDKPVQTACSAKWVQQYLHEGIDPLWPVEIRDAFVVCQRGPIYYHFVCECPSCSSTYEFQNSLTFLSYREIFCPSCFARQVVDYKNQKAFLEQKFERLNINRTNLASLDEYCLSFLQQLNTDRVDEAEKNGLPLAARYLNVDYLYLINHLIINGLFSERGL